mmetsp:Transcript_5811/g.17149  ORF Transcript_5811/g.17149 Transcript_5811/m.17149 type:complete len:479 (-) Transcript_5811:115-1551(-)
MGGGSSASKKVGVAAIDGGRYRPNVEATSSTREDEDHGNKPCDRCGEMRKTVAFGDGQHLCVACQLEGGMTAQRSQRTVKLSAAVEDVPAPQPRLRRSSTSAVTSASSSSAAPGAPAARRQRAMEAARQTSAADAKEGEGPARRKRRGAKERALAAPSDGAAPRQGGETELAPTTSASARLRRSNTVDLKLEPRTDYRSLEGLRGLREQMGDKNKSGQNDSKDDEQPGFASEISVPPPFPKSKNLGAGYHYGDRVHSLISRVRGGLLVLELGHEGTIVGGYQGAGDEDSRLLVQFNKGFDWALSPLQICAPEKLAQVKATGLPSYTWGTRVRSLITFLKPSAAKKELWLGDAGTVIGPGDVKGKLAVRFDDGLGEWSMWPSAVCEASAWDAAVAERLKGGFCRGDRVKAVVKLKGASGKVEKSRSQKVEAGEEGTVIGSGHAAGTILVHFDSDERVWSVPPDRLGPANGAGPSATGAL